MNFIRTLHQHSQAQRDYPNQCTLPKSERGIDAEISPNDYPDSKAFPIQSLVANRIMFFTSYIMQAPPIASIYSSKAHRTLTVLSLDAAPFEGVGLGVDVAVKTPVRTALVVLAELPF